MANSSSHNDKLEGPDWKFWAMWFVIAILLLLTGLKCQAKDNDRVDTVLCKPECIEKIIEKPTAKSIHYVVIYKDAKNDIEELIFMSKAVKEYLDRCKEYGVKPTLGIKLKNGEICSIVRIRKKLK